MSVLANYLGGDMRIGLMASVTDDPNASFDEVINNAKQAEAEGFDSLWMANIFGVDAISTLAIIGRETENASSWHRSDPHLSTAPGGTGPASADDCSGLPGAI